ncbi:MAG: zf-HC2 domain-containing protein [Planctomycetes bacterium]|nr:zf-HC2 domain-containing protein [Planctomycetota bacterium]
MKCEELADRLADYLGGELGGDDRRLVEAHLESCPACRGEVESLGRTVTRLRAVPTVSAEQAAERTAELEVRRRTRGPRRVLSFALRYAAVLLVGFVVGGRFGGDWIAGGGRPASKPSTPERTARADDVHPGWVRAARESRKLHAGAATIGEPLALLAGVSARSGSPR